VDRDKQSPLRRSFARLEAAGRRVEPRPFPRPEPPRRSFFPQSRREKATAGAALVGVAGAFVALVKALDDAGFFRALAGLFR